jgi:hypothetical protein
MVPLFVVTAVSLVSVSAIAQDCSGKKAQFPADSSASTTNPSGTSNVIRPELDRSTNRTGPTLNSDISATGEKTWKYAAIAVATVAGGSLAFLAYKASISRKLSIVSTVTHPEWEHPELKLTDLPKEALPERNQLEAKAADLEVLLIR